TLRITRGPDGCDRAVISDTNEDTESETPEKSVDCLVLFEPEDIEIDVIFLHGLHGAINKTWKQGVWRTSSHKLNKQSPVRRLSTGDMYVPTKDHTLKRTLSSIYSKIPNKVARREENESSEENKEYNDEDETKKIEDYSDCWPRDWIPKDCPNARVIALNYTTDVLWCPTWMKKRKRTNLIERSNEMIEELVKIGVGKHPIVWVGHSKGGLYIKQMMLTTFNSAESSEINDIFNQSKAIMWYSVPHKGSTLADFTLPLLRRSVELLEVQRKLAKKKQKKITTDNVKKDGQDRYLATSLPKKPTCKHVNKSKYKCESLTSNTMFYFHKKFYSSHKKIDQDNFILKYTSITTVERKRSRTNTRTPKSHSNHFFIPDHKSQQLVPVCLPAFCHVLNIKQGRIKGVTKRFAENGTSASERRGGNQKEFAYRSKLDSVQKFIMKFQPLDSHYCRGKIKQRIYLDPSLNITKMYKMYEDQSLPGFSVTKSYFRKVFNTSFNIGFGTPRQDVCSDCLQLIEKLKRCSNGIEKENIRAQYRIHKMRAKRFFQLLKDEDPDILILSFDCQKNLPMPRVPVDQVPVFDWKEACKNVLKPTQSLHFQISKCKRIIIEKVIKKIMVRGELSYRNDISQLLPITKRGKKISHILPNRITQSVTIKQEKLDDVNKLLKKHFGDQWPEIPELNYFRNVLALPGHDGENVGGEENDSVPEEILDFV
ncbi:unnamed protein product, partial [Diabrotica balteata]